MALVVCIITPLSQIGLSDSSKKAQGEYDLSNYFFHANLDIDGGAIEYDIHYHDKDSLKRDIIYSMKRVRNGNTIEHIQNGKVVLLYSIGEGDIEKRWPGTDSFRSRIRYVNIGDTFVDNHELRSGVTDNCKVEDHIEEFNVAEATGAKIAPNEMYKDVIHAYCQSKVHDVNGTKDYWTANKYYAYGVGLVAMEGDWVSHFGPFYATVQY